MPMLLNDANNNKYGFNSSVIDELLAGLNDLLCHGLAYHYMFNNNDINDENLIALNY